MERELSQTQIWEKISDNLRREIELSNKSKSQIAKELGVSPSSVSQYCAGTIQPSLSTFALLCRVLDILPEDVLDVWQ